MVKKIAMGTLKGGTGKTMTSFQIASVLAKKKRVLAVDADPQCNLTTNFGVDNTDLERPSIRDIFDTRHIAPEKVIIKSVIPALPNLDLLPSNIMLTATEMTLVSRSNRERLMSNWFEKNSAYLEKYDYIVFDTNPSMGLVNQNVFTLTDSIILVTDVDPNGIQGAQQFTYLWGQRREDMMLDDNVKALIVNNLDERISLSHKLLEYISQNDELGGLFVEPVLHNRVSMKKSVTVALPLYLCDPKSEAFCEVKTLVENLEKKGVL